MKPACPSIALVPSSFRLLCFSSLTLRLEPLCGNALITLCPAGSTLTHLPRQIAESDSFTDELDPEQYAEQPDRCYWKAGPEIEGQQYANDAACQNPAPVRKRSYCQRKNDFGHALDHEEYDEQKREGKKPSPGCRRNSTPTITDRTTDTN